jgi:hypothetical protein
MQKDKMSGLTIPAELNPTEHQAAQIAVRESFLHGFRWAMVIMALMCYVAAVISYFTIEKTKDQARA